MDNNFPSENNLTHISEYKIRLLDKMVEFCENDYHKYMTKEQTEYGLRLMKQLNRMSVTEELRTATRHYINVLEVKLMEYI